MARTEILISGFGGQGVIRIGQTLGTAGVLSGRKATMLKSHGTETRGGYVRAQVVLSDETIDSMSTEHPDYFIAMSKSAYERFYHLSGEEKKIFYDPAYVEPKGDTAAEQIALPARDLAVEKFGREIFANMIIFGRIVKELDGLIEKEAALEALRKSIPRALDENIRAFELGASLNKE